MALGKLKHLKCCSTLGEVEINADFFYTKIKGSMQGFKH